MTKRDKVTVDDIIGIVHTDETTNSVEEVRKLRGRTNEKRFTNSENILHDALAKSKTIKVETIEDAEILCDVLNDLNYKAELFDKIMDITLDYFFKLNKKELKRND